MNITPWTPIPTLRSMIRMSYVHQAMGASASAFGIWLARALLSFELDASAVIALLSTGVMIYSGCGLFMSAARLRRSLTELIEAKKINGIR